MTHHLTQFLAGLAVCSGGLACGATLIYEPFDDSDSELNGNASGTGLSGTWASGGFDVTSGSLGWGSMPNSGNQVSISEQDRGAVSVGTTLADAGLLDHGEKLWFSVIWKTGSTGGTNPDEAFALGTGSLAGSKNNNVPMGSSESGIGFTLKGQTDLRGADWTVGTTAVNRPTDGLQNLALDTTYLIVGEIQWGADAVSTDNISLYLPTTDLVQGGLVAAHSVVVDQSMFDTISFSAKSDGGGLDEIRFGASYADVVPVPEPHIALLGGAGLILLFRRRRS